MPRKQKEPRRVAVIDAETDPFQFGRKPRVFAWGFFDGSTYRDFWGDDATQQLVDYLASIDEPLMIYAHNGGKFDFYYLLELGLISDPLMIINGRVAKAGLGKHELRDSFAIIPIPLGKFKKESIDYTWFEREYREKYRKEILHYLAVDCESLYELVAAFNVRFGPKLTIGATAMDKIRELHPFERCKQNHDEQFRPFYYGGRVQAFEGGDLRGVFKVYDVNSMYPFVMREYPHPTGETYMRIDNAIIDQWGNCGMFGKRPYFATIDATSDGALPVRTKDGLDFPKGRFTFDACSHEVRAALSLGLLEIHAVKTAWVPRNTISFAAFVDRYIQEKIAASKSGDEIAYWFAKFLLNSGYGKFGQNPDNYRKYRVVNAYHRPTLGKEWSLYADFGSWEIWQCPDSKPIYYDVAIAASVTSAARAVLLHGINNSLRPVYCDTDSIICEGLQASIDPTWLGAWKLEAEGDRLAIAGKKLYALMSGDKCVKLASKGARMTHKDIFALARGESIVWRSDAPNFRLGDIEMMRQGKARFVQRTIERTI